MFNLKLIAASLTAVSLLSGCATPSVTQKQMGSLVDTRLSDKIKEFGSNGQAAGKITVLDESPIDFVRTEKPEIKGDVTLKAASAAFGPIVSELAKQKGYSLVFGDNVDVVRKVSLNFDGAFTEDAIRTIAFTAGYVAVVDKSSNVIYISDTGSYVFRLPPHVFEKMVAEYEVGGDATSAGGSSSGSSDSGSSSSGSASGDMKAKFSITGDTKSSEDGMRDFLKNLGGPGVKVTVTKSGYINVQGNAQGIKRVHDFLKKSVRDVMAQVIVNASIVEVSLSDTFEAGIQWGKVIDSATKGAFIGSSAAAGTNLAASALGAGASGTSSLVQSIASTAAANSSSGALNLYRVGASSESIIKALKTYSDAEVVVNPQLYATSGTPATYFDGKKSPYLASIEKTAATANSAASESGKVSFAVSGMSFSIVPYVLDDKHVSMSIIPVMSEAGDYETFMTNLKVPSQTMRNSFHNVIAEPGTTLILGGLRVSNASKSTTLGSNTSRNAVAKEAVILLRVNVERLNGDYSLVVSESI